VSPARTALAFVALALVAPAFGQELGALPLDEARDLTGDGAARLTLFAERETYYVGQAIRLRLVVDVERAFLETRMIQPFRRELDVPVQVRAEWLAALEARDPERAAADGPTLALGGSVVRADSFEARMEGGRPRVTVALERVLHAARVGALELEGPVMLFAYGTDFRDDLLQGRVALDRSDALVRGEGLVLTILPLPEAGRPPGFTGAVGRFDVRATVDRRAVQVGESLRLIFVVEGEGDLARFEAPRLELEGFDLRGVLDEAHSKRREVTFDLAPTSAAVAGVPPLPFAFFDPAPPAGYRIVETAWIPLDVRGSEANGVGRSLDDVPARAGESDRGTLSPWMVGLVCAGLGLVAWYLIRMRSRS